VELTIKAFKIKQTIPEGMSQNTNIDLSILEEAFDVSMMGNTRTSRRRL
jgi:hypothetical protein